ncbi:DNA-binding domain-containing protein, AraC-type [Pseudomonas sp. GM21]|uniref:AraC family transcriptional regulator n=1 Tax=Pseudomonas sp. GM21 TaxID=1144325 RepID=UPI0002725310|nr:AraC family transcriptional regulator [Pseudomonas sp. GM21]EJM24321.1 DNA-binding domain-containing protein, AraC-type [Pseudomonas sp. GM21]
MAEHLNESRSLRGNYRYISQQLLMGARRRQMALEPIWEAAGLRECAANEAPIKAHEFARLLRATAELLDDDLFGLTRHRAKRGTCAMMIDVALGCSTLGAAMEQVANFVRIVTDDIEVRCSLLEDQIELSVTLNDPGSDPLGFLADYWLLYLHRFFSWSIGTLLPVKQLSSTRPDVPGADRLLHYIRPGWLTGQACDALTISARYWTTPINRTRAEWYANVDRLLGQGILDWPNSTENCVSQVRALLTDALKQRMNLPRLQAIASQLCLSSQTLHRNLQQEGTSFQRILDDLRRDQAIELLAHQHLSIADAAEQLGFAETRSFSRAFKQWTGINPSALRRDGKN